MPMKASGSSNMVCDNFITRNVIGAANDFEGICGNNVNSIIYIRIAKQSPTVTDLKTYLTENPITVVYQLATPTIEVIETDLDLSTYYCVTNVTNADNANMTIEYIADTKTYIDNKLTELVSQLVTTQGEVA